MAPANKAQNLPARKPLTQERLMELLHYDPETGYFTRLKSSRTDRIGKIAGTRHIGGYRALWVDGGCYLSHRLAWLYVHGEWPPADIDHKNRCRSDDSFQNLRNATRSQNNVNAPASRASATGARGVHFHKGAQRFRVQVTKDRKTIHIGYFDTIEQASTAYAQAAKRLHGEFAE